MVRIPRKNQVFNIGKTFDLQKCSECQESGKFGESCFSCKNYASEMVQVDGTIENFVNKNRQMFTYEGVIKVNNVDDIFSLMYALCDEFAIPFQKYNLFWDANNDSVLIQKLYRRDDLWVTLATISFFRKCNVQSYRAANTSSKNALKIAEKIKSILDDCSEHIRKIEEV